MKMYVIVPIFILIFLLAGCAWKSGNSQKDEEGGGPGYRQISQEEAKRMMEADDGHVIVDVRREDEYAAGHIPGAILIPNESIGTTQPEELPDMQQVILVYCRSGNRSKQAARKLADMGYENIYEFGGILDWTGEIVTDETVRNDDTKLSFSSFDGGGPEFQIVLKDQGIVSYETSVHYKGADHEEMTGAAYTVTFLFTGIKAGETSMTIEERSPIAENLDHIYSVYVDEKLHVTIKELAVRNIMEDTEENMRLRIGENEVPVLWEENASVEALRALCPLTVPMSMYGGFEQVGSIGQSIPREDVQTTTDYGDIVLYSGSQIVLFYGSNSWAYTRLGHIDLTKEEMTELLGNGDVTITVE